MADPNRESCGRCSMTTVVDATGGTSEGRDPFEGERIELDESSLRVASPAAWFEGLSARLDALAERVIYGER
ncbi:hypothetical protein E6P09_02760 [Haloferax mediterranei ATCC 33500]|uniref:Uncharacterized protein n=1 Tax=Haloferax mediterranei (strain ATCC 33500 / DSM 1411 / JCM 8866 / NBRC 14739 / NCIMB 2177 / R-4) TaxID=523841 RepID=I3R8R9_HALMT|nr:hypothetical protein [Haloferax mediterranei]AFK20629.1 hypothetical protein HFX_2965 [Haloferax mediterranei ATCC 33500]AHZ22886.1 hypothetical protein BM92_09645 [Haloferax mediterranei ATCC 33500]EMA03051.1 hypothetical protein C439_10720 [Haloferax mediterranei ATCC 33500]MDX5987768.1 hypothetical protein [Haloferax mediterranei ATCC 33500]QCQ74247.1 hypothetical protein E6P09_02760 [Haloferax mediterranei ATCC 33500]